MQMQKQKRVVPMPTKSSARWLMNIFSALESFGSRTAECHSDCVCVYVCRHETNGSIAGWFGRNRVVIEEVPMPAIRHQSVQMRFYGIK